MKLTIYYQFYQKQNLGAQDYFDQITSTIEPDDRPSFEPIRTLFFPVSPKDAKIDELGLMTLMKNNTLCVIVKELEVSFDNVEDIQSLLDKYSQKATCYELTDKVFLNEPT